MRVAVTIRIPTTLRSLTAGQSEVEVASGSARDVLGALERLHPGFSERITDEMGALHRFVNIFVDDEDLRFLDGLDTEVPDGATVSIIPAVAGG